MFAAIEYAAVDNELAAPKTELTRKLLELLLQGCIMELKESGKFSLHFSAHFLYCSYGDVVEELIHVDLIVSVAKSLIVAFKFLIG